MTALRTRMIARDPSEEHRVSTPLELLFDLTFVVAIAQIALELAHAIADGHAGEAIVPFFMVFFAIWWAWNQFTWLASAFGADDVLYRIFTMVQMGGVLVLAAGVPIAFTEQDFGYITLGYLIMRVGLLATLIRTTIEDPESRATSGRYALGISIVQVGWLFALLVPGQFLVVAFAALATAELLVAPWAGRVRDLTWHPHHIAERYGLFTIILLGESVLAATNAAQGGLDDGVTSELVAIAIAGLVLLFAIWWLYFSEPAGEGLEARRDRSYIWGYGHYGIFAALAAVGAGLEVAVESAAHHIETSDQVVSAAVAIPVAVFLVLLWLLHAPLVERVVIRPAAIAIAVIVVLASPFVALVASVVGGLALITVAVVGLLAFTLVDSRAGWSTDAGVRSESPRV